MASLRILTLESCGVTIENLEPVTCGCPLLEELSLAECPMLERLSFFATNIHKLKLVQGEDVHQISIIKCPNLKSFIYEGVIQKLQLEDLSSLQNVSLDIRFSYCEGFEDFVWGFQCVLEKIQHVVNVSLSQGFVAMFACSMVKNFHCPFNCWKRVVLNMGPSGSYMAGVYVFLRNSPYLEELTLNLSQRDSASTAWEIQQVLEDPESLPFSDWNSRVRDYICLGQHLKNVTINGYGKGTSALVLRFVEVLIGDASVLDKLMIERETEFRRKDMVTNEVLCEFMRKLLAIPRHFSHAAILMS